MEEDKDKKKNSKKNYSFEYIEQQLSEDSDYQDEDYEEDLLEHEYFEETLNIIHKEFSNFISDKSLPISEFLNKNKIKIFLSKNLDLKDCLF